jgi:hypothetical protein
MPADLLSSCPRWKLLPPEITPLAQQAKTSETGFPKKQPKYRTQDRYSLQTARSIDPDISYAPNTHPPTYPSFRWRLRQHRDHQILFSLTLLPTLRRLNSSTETMPPLPLHNEINTTIPSGSSSSTFEPPYHSALQQFQPQQGPSMTLLLILTPPQISTPTPPTANQISSPPPPQPRKPNSPSESPSASSIRPMFSPPTRIRNPVVEVREGRNLRLRLDLNLNGEVTRKASVGGDWRLPCCELPILFISERREGRGGERRGNLL